VLGTESCSCVRQADSSSCVVIKKKRTAHRKSRQTEWNFNQQSSKVRGISRRLWKDYFEVRTEVQMPIPWRKKEIHV
jgi:hypothetical protein